MPRIPKTIAKLAAKGLLLLVGGAVGCGTVTPVYGMPVTKCVDEAPCKKLGENWVCNHDLGSCEWAGPDAGTSTDAGTSPDTGR